MTHIHAIGLLGCILIMGVIVALGPYSTPEMFLPDQGVTWYYWKLPEPEFWARFSAWTLYALHQLGLWGLIAWAQIHRPAYTPGLHRVNAIAIGFNALFVALHILQTRLFYDGLAQDTPVMASQLSVIFMLVFVLLMENSRRGLFFGYRVSFLDEPGSFLRKYHGYYFSWAIVYTFWFHPIEDTYGHLLGTFYILMLLLQGSLFFTRAHRQRVWTMLLEAFVVIHGAVVAYHSVHGEKWQMFLFGFLTLFAVTQVHGVGLGRRTRSAIVLAFVACVAFTYRGRGWDWLEVLRIPFVEYALVFACAAVLWIPVLLRRRSRPGGLPRR